jgi:hypothetical protein
MASTHMYHSRHITLALLSAIVIGAINVASMSFIYVLYQSSHKPAQSALVQGTTPSPSSGSAVADTSTNGNGQANVQSTGSGTVNIEFSPSPSASSSSSTATKSPSSSGSAGGTSSGGGTKSSGGSATPTPIPTSGSSGGSTPKPTPVPAPTPSAAPPASLAKGSPCKTQVPPAGVCQAVLSFNSQKDGNPYWDPTLLTNIKAGIASDSFVQLLGLNPTTIYNSMTVTINESTWSGNATHGTIAGTMSADGQSSATTFTLDWKTNKWVVDDAAQN